MPEKDYAKCPCKWKNCTRFGKCDECIKHHLTHKRYPLPYCRRKEQKNSGKEKKPPISP